MVAKANATIAFLKISFCNLTGKKELLVNYGPAHVGLYLYCMESIHTGQHSQAGNGTRQAARFIMNSSSHLASVTELLNKLNMPSLSSRRDNMKLITMYKLINYHISMSNNGLTLLHTPTRGHPYQYN